METGTIHQHRHVFPGYEGPDNKWWHSPTLVHKRYPTAHDGVIEEREHTPVPRGPRTAKQEALVLSFNEWGEPLTQEDVYASKRLYTQPPEYAALDAEAMVKEAAAHLMKTAAKNKV